MRCVDAGSAGLRAIAFLVAMAVSGPCLAEPLSKEACEALVVEQQGLIAAGVKDDFAKGADWGKANLKADRLAQVGRYLDVEEQLSFRCGLAKVRYSLPADEETPAAPAVTEEPKAPPKAKPAPKAKPKAKAAAAEREPAAVDAPAAAKVQAKRKPAAKPNDAFKPETEPAAAPATAKE